MRRVPTMIITAGAASLSTLAAAVAVPAIGDDGKGPAKGDGIMVVHAGPAPEELRACLKDHGLDAPDGDPVALKQWIGEHLDEAATRKALEACGPEPVGGPDDVRCAVGKPGAPPDGEKRTFKFRVERSRQRSLPSDGE
jgi:hypothetical protein